MSSNAFARSRPKDRVARTRRTHSGHDHPRFTQLVNELSRLNDLKKKQEEVETNAADSCKSDSDSPVIVATSSTTCLTSNVNKASSGNNSGVISCSANNNCSGIGSGNIMNICSGLNLKGIGISCCSSSVGANAPQTSNGYRSLDRSQSSISSNLHDNYHLHHHHQHQQIFNQPQHHQANHLHHNHQHQFHHREPHQVVQQQSDDRCLGKSSTSSFGYSKQNIVLEQAGSGSSFLNGNVNTSSNLHARQDENCSKRKTSENEASNHKKKSKSCSGASIKKDKSIEAIRPLSPSFTKCPICLLDCMDRDPSFTNTCFHLFCYVCIENWTKNKATCPLCRTKFTKIIYNIKSATKYEEKVASPIRREDDEVYADRYMLDQLTNLNYTPTVPNRNSNSDDGVQFLFESRNAEGQQSYFVNHISSDPRQGESLHSFNPIAVPPSFILNVPHPTFGWMAPMTSHPTAITSAYTGNTSLPNINNESSLRRMSRSSRYYSRTNYEPQGVDGSDRVTRTSNNAINQPAGVIPLERHNTNQHQHHSNPHQSQHHQHGQHRATMDMTPRHQRIEQPHTSSISLRYPTPSRHYNQSNVGYSRRPYNAPQMEHHQQQQHILDTLYRMPDM